MSMLSQLIEEAGACADSVQVFVFELLHSLEDRIANLEKSLALATDTSVQTAAPVAPAASVAAAPTSQVPPAPAAT